MTIIIMIKNTTTLMYHGIIAENKDVPKGRETGAQLYDVSIDDFKKHMKHLQAVSAPNCITFDDGELNNFKNAFPVLTEYNQKAYFFITVNWVGLKGYMNWEQLEELHNAGMIIGSHGLNHVILTELNDSQLKDEFVESKNIMEQRLKSKVYCLSLSRGFFNEKVINLAKEAGYQEVFVSGPGKNDNYCIGRTAVKGSWDLKRFEIALEGKMPFGEQVLEIIKRSAKKILGAAGYDKLRGMLIKIW